VVDNGISSVSIERKNRTIVSLRISNRSADNARETLRLAAPLQTTESDPRSLWIAPNHCLLVSDNAKPDAIIEDCDDALTGIVYNVFDQSAGLAVFRLAGHGARGLLAMGSGVDFRPTQFPVGACCRTRLAQVAAIVVAIGMDDLDIYVNRSYESYLGSWLEDSKSMSDLQRERVEK